MYIYKYKMYIHTHSQALSSAKWNLKSDLYTNECLSNCSHILREVQDFLPIKILKLFVGNSGDLEGVIKLVALINILDGDGQQDATGMWSDILQLVKQILTTCWWLFKMLGSHCFEVVWWDVSLHVIELAIELNLNDHTKRRLVTGITAIAIILLLPSPWVIMLSSPGVARHHRITWVCTSSPAKVEAAVGTEHLPPLGIGAGMALALLILNNLEFNGFLLGWLRCDHHCEMN